MTTIGSGHERRASSRQRCLKGARIVLANGNSTLACRIRNQSELGMRLAADETSFVPPTFTLVRDGSTTGHQCQVIWRSGREVGARIVADKALGTEGYSRSASLHRPREQHIVNRYPV